MAMPRIYITRPLPTAAMKRLEGVVEYRMWEREDQPVPRDTLLDEIAAVDGIICLFTEKMDAQTIDRACRCRVIAQVAVGYDNIDVDAATKRGILVTNTPEVLTETTADMAWAILMATASRVVEGDKFTRAGRWEKRNLAGLTGQDVHGATLGIIGLGRVGSAVARRSKGFDMPLLYYDLRRNEGLERQLGVMYLPLDDVLRRSDFVMLTAALTPQTRHLIGEREFELMKPSAVIVNISCGPIIDQHALYRALVDKRIWAAGLDVLEVEPPPVDEPLLKLENVVLPPHLGSASIATRIKMAELAAENCVAGVTGKRPPSLVNPEALERR
ncbi:MAG TPA: D-glycerate dehydrogenase [bacterium]|nr:D-glycerate dehydrogenase [bacterium]